MAAHAVRSAETRLRAAAAQLVRGAAPAITPPAITPVEAVRAPNYQPLHVAMESTLLADRTVNLKKAELDLRAGIALFRATDRMTRRTLDIVT